MKKIIVEPVFWELFPDAEIGVVVAIGVDNECKDEDKYQKLLEDGETKAKSYLTDVDFSQNSVIKVWREALQKFKTKKGARSSIEALLKRVNNGNHIGNINPLVDIYNSVSLSYALPCGGEDIDKVQGNMLLTKANGGEDFITYGSDKSEPPYPDEIIYKDDFGAICRCLNWREAVRTALTEETKNVILCMESVDPSRKEDLKNAIGDLASKIEMNLGGTIKVAILTKDNPEFIIK